MCRRRSVANQRAQLVVSRPCVGAAELDELTGELAVEEEVGEEVRFVFSFAVRDAP